MVAGALHHGGRARVAHRKAFARHAIEEGLALDGAVEHRVAGNNLFGSEAPEIVGRAHDDASSRQALAHVVIGLTHQVQRDAPRQEGTERLSGHAIELDMDGIVRQALVREAAHHLAGEHGAHGPVHVADGLDEADLLATFQCRPCLLDQDMIQRALQPMILRLHLATRHVGRHGRVVEHPREIQPLRLPVLDAAPHVQKLRAADQLVEGAHPQLRHQLAHFIGHEEEVVHDVLGLAGETAAQHRILRGHAHRAGVEVALAHHDAALGHQRCRGKAEFIGAQDAADHHVAPGLHLTIGLDAHAAAQAVEHQRLLRFGKPQLPRRAGMLERRQRAGARAAIVAGNGDVVRLGLGDTRGHRAHAHFRHQLHRNGGAVVGVLQVMNELGNVLDGIDVVVRRRRDESHARHRAAQPRDVVADLVTGQLPALARLGALRHLDLDLVGRGQVFGGDAKAPGRHLLDARAQRVARLQGIVGLHHILAQHTGQRGTGPDGNALQILPVTHRILTALAGVGLATNAVHGHSQRGMRLGGDGTQRHRPRGEALDDLGGRFHLIQRDGPFGVEAELEESAQRHQTF